MNLVQTGSWQILGPELTKQTSSEATWGFVLSIRGLGLLVMSALMYRVVVAHLLRVGQLGGALGALPLLALGVQLGVPWLIVSAFVAGLGTSLSAISWETSLQEHVPGPVLSRVASYDDLLSYIAIPIGQLAVGPLADGVRRLPDRDDRSAHLHAWWRCFPSRHARSVSYLTAGLAERALCGAVEFAVGPESVVDQLVDLALRTAGALCRLDQQQQVLLRLFVCLP